MTPESEGYAKALGDVERDRPTVKRRFLERKKVSREPRTWQVSYRLLAGPFSKSQQVPNAWRASAPEMLVAEAARAE